MLEFEPTLIACVVSSGDYSFGLRSAGKECVINILTVDIAEPVVRCGNSIGEKIDKFEKYSLTSKTAKIVAAPLIYDCYAKMESGSVELAEREMFVMPKGVRHKPVAEAECHMMLIERKTTLHTGDVVTGKTRSLAEQLRAV